MGRTVYVSVCDEVLGGVGWGGVGWGGVGWGGQEGKRGGCCGGPLHTSPPAPFTLFVCDGSRHMGHSWRHSHQPQRSREVIDGGGGGMAARDNKLQASGQGAGEGGSPLGPSASHGFSQVLARWGLAQVLWAHGLLE